MLIWIAVALALALGYAMGRVRPAQRFAAWNWRRAMWGMGRGRAAAGVEGADGLLFMALHPIKSWRAIHAEPKPPAAATLDPDWFRTHGA